MQNLKLMFAALLLMVHVAASSQNMGVGTDTPTKKLSVAGSIAVDHDNANTGTLDSAALVFGTGPSVVGIFSQKTPGTGSYNGLDFWTNGERRMIITEEGTVGINAQNPDLSSKLFVGGKIRSYSLETNSANIGNAYISSNAYFDLDANIDGEANVGNRVNINGNTINNEYRLTVNDGHSFFDGHGVFNGWLSVNEDLDVDGEISADEDIFSYTQVRAPTLRATEHMAVGGSIDPVYRLRVWDGNSRFGGDVQVTGTLNAGELNVGDLNAGDITASSINGTGVMHSAGPSSLSMGFNIENINLTLAGGNQLDLTVNITDFSGGPDDIRVMIGQFVPDPLPQYANWHDFSLHVHSVDPVNDTCKLRVTNTTGANLSMKGTLYLVSVVKD